MNKLFLMVIGICCAFGTANALSYRMPWSAGLSSLNLVYVETGALYAFSDHQDSQNHFDSKGVLLLGSAGAARAKLSLGYADISRDSTYLGYAVMPHVGYTWKSYAYGTNGLFVGTAARLSFGMAVLTVGVDKALNDKRPLKYIEVGIGW